jgi:N-acetylmuramoyl-L-alanine amidase
MSLEWLQPQMRAIVEQLPDEAVLGLTLWGEARSEPIEGIVAVACVIRNRKADTRWPDTYRDVCLQRRQFSCWRPEGGEKNYLRMLEIGGQMAARTPVTLKSLEQCAWVALGITRGVLDDRAKGGNHYHTASLAPRPSWAKNAVPVVQSGSHVFYKL